MNESNQLIEEDSKEGAYRELYRLIPREEINAFQLLSPLRRFGGFAFDWLGVFGAILLCERFFSIPLYLLTVLWLSARILSLGLIMHDGVHGLVFRNRRMNDWITEWFASWPVFVSMRSYRVKHLAHHANLNTGQDPDFVAKASHPDWQFPMTPSRVVYLLLRIATGVALFSTYKVMSEKEARSVKKDASAGLPWTYHLLRAAYYSAILGSLIYAGHLRVLLLYWAIPIATGLQVLNRMRRIAEHSGIYDKALPFQTRTTIHGVLARLFFSPGNIAYHNEHHLYPGVPLYRLPKLHGKLMRHALARERLHVTHSYLGVFRELCAEPEKTS